MLKRVLIVTGLLIILASTCLAASSDSQTLEVSWNHYHYGYSEVIGDSENAWLNGMHLSYKNQDNTSKNFWKVSYDRTSGNTQYAYDGTPPAKSITNDKFTNTEVTYGVPVSNDKKQFVYIGYGNRAWDRNLNSVGDYGGYLEKYSWGYIPVGYRLEYNLNAQWDGAVDIAAKFMFGGKMSAYYNGGFSGPGLIGSQFNLGNKPGLRVEAPFTTQLAPQLSLVLTPWYEYSGIKKSNIVGGYLEPDSSTTQWGVNVGVSYKF